MKRDWSVLLLGGTTASGKSTSAWKLARQLGIGCISADSVWRAVLAMTTAESHPVLYQWPRPEVMPDSAERLTQVHIEEAEALTPAIEAFIDWELKERNRFVIHGAWITPEFAARKCVAEDLRAVFIDEPDEGELLGSMVKRSGRTEPNERQLALSRVASMYGKWLCEGANRLGLPTVPARPRETLVDRIVAATG